jgi:hypothetical protein
LAQIAPDPGNIREFTSVGRRDELRERKGAIEALIDAKCFDAKLSASLDRLIALLETSA